MFRLKRTICAYILATVLLPTAAQATTYYVDPNGSDSNNGTSEDKPFRTIKKGASALRTGDTTYIKNGVYEESGEIRIFYGGTQAAPVKLMAYPGHAPVLRFPVVDPNNPTYHQLILNQAPGHNTPIGWVTVEGLTIENGSWGIHGYACNHCTFRRNWFKDQFHSGILLWSAIDTVIDRNIISDAGSAKAGAHGVYLTGSRYVITNNIIYRSEKYGIQLNGTMTFNPTDFPSQDYSDTKNAIIANNVLAYSKRGAGIVIWGWNDDNAIITNNIFYENWQTGPSSYPNGINCVSCSESTGIIIKNNIFYASEPGGTVGINSGLVEGINYTQSGNLVNTSNPGFVNAPETLSASPNFALTRSSPAIDAGLPSDEENVHIPTIRIDFKGTTRPQGHAYDIGAYEYSTSGDHQAPAAPTLQLR